MASWNELLKQLQAEGDPDKVTGLIFDGVYDGLRQVGALRQTTNVVLYGSAFMQKPNVPSDRIAITADDINGFMSVIHGMDWEQKLCLLLHTPGGAVNAAETVVEYLRDKFPEIEVIVPTEAMSAGTMISLGSDHIVMGRQSQLGPIDPQLNLSGRSISAGAVVAQFNDAKEQIQQDPALAHLWAPITQSLGPSLLKEAQWAMGYSEQMVENWLARYMLKGQPDRAKSVAQHFSNPATHMSHGRRINRTEAREQGLSVEDLEESQELQEAVLTTYHWMTLMFDQTILTSCILGSNGQSRVKGFALPES